MENETNSPRICLLFIILFNAISIQHAKKLLSAFIIIKHCMGKTKSVPTPSILHMYINPLHHHFFVHHFLCTVFLFILFFFIYVARILYVCVFAWCLSCFIIFCRAVQHDAANIKFYWYANVFSWFLFFFFVCKPEINFIFFPFFCCLNYK